MSLFKPRKVVVFKLNLQKDNDIIAGKFETVSMGICVLNNNKDTKLANNQSLCLALTFYEESLGTSSYRCPGCVDNSTKRTLGAHGSSFLVIHIERYQMSWNFTVGLLDLIWACLPMRCCGERWAPCLFGLLFNTEYYHKIFWN